MKYEELEVEMGVKRGGRESSKDGANWDKCWWGWRTEDEEEVDEEQEEQGEDGGVAA